MRTIYLVTLAVLLTVTVLLAACTRPASPGSVRGVESSRDDDVATYMEARARLIQQERSRRLGASLVLTPDEEKADRKLAAMKQAELDRTRAYFPPAHSFLLEKTRQVIAASPVLDVMKRMPKGGILHAHGSAMGDFRWLVSEVTYRPDCYVYVLDDGSVLQGTLRLSADPPGEGWRQVMAVRAAAPDRAAFDEQIYRSITLGEEDLGAPHIWDEMSKAFRRTSGLLGDPSVYAAYWRGMLSRLIDENVQYLESRTTQIDETIIAEARNRDRAFDVKFIPAAGRSNTHERMQQLLSAALERRANDSDRIKGFDLVEEEDRTNTTVFFINELLAVRRDAERRGTTLPFYLHSGESTWAENENLYDAVLLGARRIGHGLALIKHPLLMEMVKSRGIAVEVCPISNQILGYVPDLRNHPAVHYISAGLPVVLSPDDPAIMRHTFSEDFYVAFMAWGLDLKALKQLAMNSLLHSAMSEQEKQAALASWRLRWETFVQWLNQPSVSSSRPPLQGH
jgi:adenosine deaminase CECR1